MAAELEGQTAIVTGGGRGLGRAMAIGLAGAGAGVTVLSRTESEIAETVARIQARGGRALAHAADVLDARAVEDAVRRTECELGPVELLVNNAGTGDAIGPSWEVDADAWWRDVEVVLRGAHLCSRAVLPGMLERGRGRIVNVASRAGGGGLAYQTAYSASRAAVFQFSEGLAKELEPHGIRVFAFTPGMTRTALTEHILESEAGRTWIPGYRAMAEDPAAWTEPERVAGALVWVAAGRADALSGRWLHAGDDLGRLVGRAGVIVARDLRTLRLRE